MNNVNADRQSSDTQFISSDTELVMLVAAAMDEMRKEEPSAESSSGKQRWKTWRSP